MITAFARCSASVANAVSISATVQALRTSSRRPSARAPSRRSAQRMPASGIAGIHQERNQRGLGKELVQQLDVLVSQLAENQLTPVTFASGRLRLATSPALTGSRPLVKTIGIVDVSALATNAVLFPPTAAMTATLRETC